MKGILSNMTSVYILRGNDVLMLYRQGSRALLRDSWVGIGGHFEERELNDARACILREVEEEIGLKPEDLTHLELRYIALRAKAKEISLNYYFFANLADEGRAIRQCSEGRLEWVPLHQVLNLDMPHTARCVMEHYINEGKNNQHLYIAAATKEGAQIVKADFFAE